MENYPIDFVISWVDGNDEDWLAKRQQYRATKGDDTRKRRVREWNNLQFLLRGIDKYANWVNHVYLLTPGHYPKWLDLDCERISVINQDILFPEELVPSFNNCAVELLMYKIPGLSEHFVYFNDDMFLLKKAKPEDFFKNGLPLDTVGFAPTQADYKQDGGKGQVYGIAVMCTRLIAKRYTKQEILNNSKGKFYSPRNGKDLIKTICMMPWHNITGFNETHTATSFLKSTFEEMWNLAEDDMVDTLNSRFRHEFNVAQWAVRFWQIATGKFEIRNPGFSKFYDVVYLGDEKPVVDCITKGKTKVICINDNVDNDDEFDEIVTHVNKAFERKFPQESQFEKKSVWGGTRNRVILTKEAVIHFERSGVAA
ncbi:MAG: Stealth CR1 domain-containing protein [Ruminococcus sp.]|nr:Stealth CR1 domain-containing protein [Ruminococcus sp.]